MINLYLMCLLPIFIGAGIYFFSHKVHIYEWLIGSACCFLVAGIIHATSYYSQVGDFETWSGKVDFAKKYSAWKEQYEEAIYVTKTHKNSDGTTYTTTEFSHYETRRRWHDEYFVIETNIDSRHYISKEKYEYFVSRFGNVSKVKGDRQTFEIDSHMIDGDPFDYETYAKGVVEPINESRRFENRLRASKSVFNFAEIPQNVKLFEYPKASNLFQSKRVLGEARKSISTKEWDCLNAELGPIKKVNLIIVGFDSSDSMLAEWQKAKWLGGKKNDIVICYGIGWVKVFGWSDSELCKKNIETLLLRNKIDNDLLPKIKKEVLENYKETDWNRFDHLKIEPTKGNYLTLFILLILTQSGLYVIFHKNEFNR